MQQEWKQFVFGKIVQSSDGPIVSGKDHECTGSSPDIPERVIASMVPSIIGPGISDLTNWNSYIWNEQKGGIAIQSILCDDEPWVVACRVRGRSEGGEGKQGRFYTQAHYLTIPAAGFSPSSIIELADTLIANPMTQKEAQLPHLVLEKKPRELPLNWLERISVLLEILLSGLPLSIQNTKLSMREIEELFHIVFSALPLSLAWRLSVRLGAEKINDGETILGLGQEIYCSTRMIGFDLDNPEKNVQKLRQIENAIPHPIQKDKMIGQRYVEFLHNHASSCRTDIDLQKLLQREFPHMMWDYFPLSYSFTEAGILFVQDIFERDALEQITNAQQGHGVFPDPRMFSAYREKALLLGLESIWQNAANFVSQTIDLWPEQWNSLPSHLSYFQILLCPNQLWNEDIISLLREDMPIVLQNRIEKGLWYQIQHSTHSFWNGVCMQWNSLPSWFQSVIQKREKEICSMFISFDMNEPGWISKCIFLPSCLFFQDCLQGIIPEKNSWTQWISLFGDEKNRKSLINHLIEQIFCRHISLGCVLLSWTKEELALSKFFSVSSLASWNNLDMAVHEILSQEREYTSYEIHILLVGSVVGEAHNIEKIRQRLTPILAPHIGVLLWDISTNGGDEYTEFASSLIHFCIHTHHELFLSQRLHTKLDDFVLKKSAQLIVDFLYKHPQWKTNNETLLIVHALVHGQMEPVHQSIDLELFKILLMGISNPQWSTQIQSLPLLEIYIHTHPHDISISPSACHLLLKLSQQEQKKWMSIIDKHTLSKEPFWRLLWGVYNSFDIVVFADPKEEILLQKLDDSLQYVLFAAGISFSCSIPATTIPESLIQDVLWVCLSANHEKLQDVVLRQALARLKQEDNVSFEKLSARYSVRQNFFQTFWSKIQGLFVDSNPKKRPLELSLMQICAIILQTYSHEKRTSFFM